MCVFFTCDPEESRTPNLLIRSQMLYPIKLRDHRFRLTKVEKNHSLKIESEKKPENPVRFFSKFKKTNLKMDSEVKMAGE